MHLVRRITAVFVLALWLTATQHCGLEAAGLFAGHAESEAPTSGCCTSNAGGCVDDGCETVEGSLYRSDQGTLKVALPEFLLCVCLLHAPLETSVPAGGFSPVGERTDFSAGWLPIWQFERRAAAPAHAPDTLIA